MPSDDAIIRAEFPLLAKAVRSQGLGLGLLAVAGLLWVGAAVLLATPYGDDNECPAPIASEYVHDNDCVEELDWPLVTALFGGSVPFAALGAGAYASGSAVRRVAEHLERTERA
ncbi:hypothetical protein [Streptomyces termitum]|uniref:hypothetical protein n=1 Tax=Streptomyces termitum TaxID=67368 RepID=UPI0037B6A331